MSRLAVPLVFLACLPCLAGTEFERIYLASVPRPLPDGKAFVFVWRGDIWRAPMEGGTPVQLTRHPAEDHWPCVSPDGREIAFNSKRNDSRQIYIMPAKGGEPERITQHTEGYRPLAWFPDGKAILAHGLRDHAGTRAGRLFKVYREPGKADELLFDAYAHDADLSPDGKRVLFTREGVSLYRKGYRGSKASQIWLYDLVGGDFTCVRRDSAGARSPLWRPDGKGFYYVSQEDGCFNVWEHDLSTGETAQRTHFSDASVIIPGLSRDGRTMLFRQLFDFHRWDPTSDDAPVQVRLDAPADLPAPGTRRRWYTSLWNNDRDGTVSFTDDGLQMCFTAGGDLWTMDTVLKEPKQITDEAGIQETEATFTPDGMSIVFLRDFGDRVEVWRATRKNADRFWWQDQEFALEPLVTDRTAKHGLSVSPEGTRLAYCTDPGGIIVAGIEGADPKQVAASTGRTQYDWAPDGKWLACTLMDDNRSRDVWIVSVDGEHPPYNVSRHPKTDSGVRWSPDGRIIAFVGRREDDKPDVCYVYLCAADDEETKRDRTLEKALAKMEEKGKNGEDKNNGNGEKPAQSPERAKPAVTIDFDGLADRVRRLDLKDANPGHLFWSFDSKALAFHATIDGKRGTYKVFFPDELKPALMTEKTGTQARWIEDGSKVVWLVDRVPAHLNATFPFKAFQYTDIVDYQRLAFRLIWRAMRDRFYDASLNNLDWTAVLAKYEDAAAFAPDRDVFERAVAMLLGELNASHTGFHQDKTSRKEWGDGWSSRNWSSRTGHTGLRFDASHEGPGLKVKHVIPDGPTDRDQSRIRPGEVVLTINGRSVTPYTDLANLLSGVFPRDDVFTVRGAHGAEREVTVRTVSFGDARELLREEEIRTNRKSVETRSKGTLGYLHIAKMQWADLHKFEREVFSRGTGREGLVIDVRGNTGGFVADRLLAILCNPVHAITVPRGGARSYPADYLGKAVWDKPLVVLCDQNTTSNGEIFCHAIKTLGRGKIVGVPTQGAVIATPDKKILDMGTLRIPERGWFVGNTGQDMELNGCVPDVVLWPDPGELPAGIDRQLEKAIDVLLEDVAETKKTPPIELVPASRLRQPARAVSYPVPREAEKERDMAIETDPVRRGDGSTVLDDVKRLPSVLDPNIPAAMNHPAGLVLCAHRLGLEATPAWVYGASGFAFALNIHEAICPSGPTAWQHEATDPLAANAGLRIERFVAKREEPEFAAGQEKMFGLVCKSIDDGRLVIGWEMMHPDWYPVVGYDQDGNYVFCHVDDSVKKVHHTKIGHIDIPISCCLLVDRGKPADDRKTVRDALQFAVKNAADGYRFTHGPWHTGAAGYDAWIAALSKDDPTTEGLGQHYNAMCWGECRAYAVPFLKEAEKRLGIADLAPAFERAIEHYQAVADALAELSRLSPMDWSKTREANDRFNDPERCKQWVKLLTAARDAESKGIQALAEIADRLGDE